MQLGRNFYTLRTMAHARSAGNAAVGLAKPWHRAVIAVEEGPALGDIVGVGCIGRLVAVDDTAVIVRQDCRYVEAVGARHTVVAIVAWYGIVAQYLVGGAGQESVFLGTDWLEGRICSKVVGKMLHIRHAAQHGEYAFGGTGKSEGPRGNAVVGSAFLHLVDNGDRHVGKAAAEQRLHNDHGYAALVELIIKVFGIHVAFAFFLRAVPVYIVELDLHEIPFTSPRSCMARALSNTSMSP